MKKPGFLILVILVSLIIILSMFSWYKKNSLEESKKELEAFLSIKNELYWYNPDTKNFSQTTSNKTEFFYQSINPIDGIYYKSNLLKEAVSIKKDSAWINIKIKEWQYIFSLNDVFQKYEIISDNFKISQLGKGLFFVDNTKNNYKVYSLNSILSIKLLEWNKAPIDFKLFPSLLFKYNPSYNSILRWADILRISMIDSIYYLDFKWTNTISVLTGARRWKENIISVAMDDIRAKLLKYKNLYNLVLKMKFDNIWWFDFITNYQSFFNNETKKDVYFKSVLIKNFLDIINNSWLQSEHYANIALALDEMSKLWENKKQEWVELLKNYYYLAYYGKILINNSDDIFRDDNSIANKVIRQIFKDDSTWDDHFALLSDIFFSYQFSDSDQNIDIDLYLNNYLAWLKQKKILKDEDFLSFSFFLTQYSLANTKISKNSISIIVYLIEFFNNYFLTIKDWWKWFNALWVQFYNFSKIISWVNNWLIKTYFNKKPDWVFLKSEYIDDSWTYPRVVNLWEDTLSYLSLLYTNGLKDLFNKRAIFRKNLNAVTEIEMLTSNYWELEKKYNSLGIIIGTLKDYNKYIEELKLNSRNREAKALIYSDSFILSFQDAISYLSKFNWIDISSIKILNQQQINTDRYYDIQVIISWYNFSFKLVPEGHIIKDLVISDSSLWWVNNSFKGQVIYLDDKQKLFTERYASETNLTKKQRYDFSNFFINIFINAQDIPDETSSWDNSIDSNNSEPKDISIFKQDKLIEWDFTYINKFLDIPFKAVNISIVWWEYSIKLTDIKKMFSYQAESFNTEMNTSYNFTDKYFYNTQIKIYNVENGSAEFGGNTIDISPSTIRLQYFSKQLENLWQYIYTLKSKYDSSAWNIKFDLNLWKVFIDSKSYDLIK